MDRAAPWPAPTPEEKQAGEIRQLNRQYSKVASALRKAELRMGNNDMVKRGVQDRNIATVEKHRTALRRLEKRLRDLNAWEK